MQLFVKVMRRRETQKTNLYVNPQMVVAIEYAIEPTSDSKVILYMADGKPIETDFEHSTDLRNMLIGANRGE